MPTYQDRHQWLFLKHGHLLPKYTKRFSDCAARLITEGGGEITAYDGDRIMGVFIDDRQSTNAAICALKINHATKNIIMPALKYQYPKTNFTLRHVVGIDTESNSGRSTGVRGDNDIVWVGSAANHAAKLTELDAANATWITGSLFKYLHGDAKYANNANKALMWEKRLWTPDGKYGDFLFELDVEGVSTEVPYFRRGTEATVVTRESFAPSAEEQQPHVQDVVNIYSSRRCRVLRTT